MKKLTKKILIFLNLVLVISLGLSYLGNFINPGKAWVFAFFGLAYPYLLLGNIFFVLFWWWRRNKLALISLVIVVFGFTYIGRYFQVNFKSRINSGEVIKVFSYNVRIFNHFEWQKEQALHDSIISYINQKSPDILCLQEFISVNLKPELNEDSILKKLTSVSYSHIEYTKQSVSRNEKFGIATFSRYPIVNRGVVLFPNSPNPCIYTDLFINTDTIRVYNAHLQSIKLKKNNYGFMDSIFHINSRKIGEVKDISSRLKRAFIARSEQVDILSEHMENSPYPVLLCGDFNDTPVSYTYQKLIGRKKDAFRESGVGIGTTYRGNLPSYRIDYIFHSTDFKSLDYKKGKVVFSDHFPVMAEFLMEH